MTRREKQNDYDRRMSNARNSAREKASQPQRAPYDPDRALAGLRRILAETDEFTEYLETEQDTP